MLSKLYNNFRQYCYDNIHIHTVYNSILSLKNLVLYGFMSPRIYIVSREKKIVYFLNSKVANSSIKATMYSGDTEDDNTIHRAVKDSGMKKFKLSTEESEYFKFTFVRNPFEKIVSCYESKYHIDKKYNNHKKFLRFDTYLFGYLRKDKGFDNFVGRVARIPDKWLEDHIRLQYDLIHDNNGNKLVDYIGKYENLAEDFKQIQEKYDLKPLPHYNNSGGEKRDWRSYYTLETAELVYKKYKKDFECFGYEDSYKDLVAYLKDRENK